MARHPSVEGIVQFFDFDHLPDNLMKQVSEECAALQEQILRMIPEDNPELTVGLRKLLEAKDCFVRAALLQVRS